MKQVELKGFINLIGLIFVTNNCREIVDNCLKYGWVVKWVILSDLTDHLALLIGTSSIIILALIGYVLEYYRGLKFAESWSHAIVEMQQIELQLQAAKTSHNIYKLKPSPPAETREDETDYVESGQVSQRRTGRTPSYRDKSVTSEQQNCHNEPSHADGEDESDSRSSVSDDNDVEITPDIVTSGLYNNARQRYIDATKNLDLTKIVSAAEDYVRSQQEKIKVIKDELNDFMTPLVTVYNNLSLRITEHHVEFVHCTYTGILCCLMLVLPYLTILSSTFDPLSSLFMLMLSCTWLLKMISFFHTLHCLRRVIISDTKSLRNIVPFDDERASYLHYPHSLKFDQFITYLIAPTLCFQFNYPRSPRRNWSKIGKTFIQLLFSLVLLKIIFEQYLKKILENTYQPPLGGIRGGLRIIERLLKLSIPTLYCWLLMFVSFFHYWMILLAELTRFEDKEFYRDWWNATSFSDYWRKWNIPVHNFCRRHIYHTLLSYGFSRYMAGQIVFILSAIAHEYIIAGSLKLGWTGMVFLSFVMQTPLSILTESKFIRSKPLLGNAIFWIVFSFTGQPMGVLIFYYLWNLKAATITGAGGVLHAIKTGSVPPTGHPEL